ncbi:hypothetical protein LXL04_036414 [Taraxacum kok-saghyz]
MANATMMIITMNQAIREQRGVFEVGDEVEVTGREGDIGVPFYPRVITNLETGKATDGKTLIETVDIENIRPKPIDFRFKFKWGDYVDVWVRQRWFPLSSDVGWKKASCILFTSEEDEISVFEKENVRASLTWKYENRGYFWNFKKMLRDLI